MPETDLMKNISDLEQKVAYLSVKDEIESLRKLKNFFNRLDETDVVYGSPRSLEALYIEAKELIPALETFIEICQDDPIGLCLN